MLFTSKKGHEVTNKQSAISMQTVIYVDMSFGDKSSRLNATYNRS
jgi:hypothetical protein